MGYNDIDLQEMLTENPEWKKVWFSDAIPQHTVYIDGFWIYKYEVTVAQYRRFCEESGRQMPRRPTWGWKDDHPIVRVTWSDAQAYAHWASCRLPTEAEWEKAARGTDGRRYPWGNNWNEKKLLRRPGTRGGNLCQTAPVNSFPENASPFGVLDMEGNVGEWCADWYSPTYYSISPYSNPQGPASGNSRVRRGGSWYDDNLAYFQVARRFSLHQVDGYQDIGFRCAVSLLE